MTEYSFRLTQKQFDFIGGLLATDEKECFVIADCGKGKAEWSHSVEHKSWCIKGTPEVWPIEKIAQFSPTQKNGDCYCIFVNNEDRLHGLFRSNADILWATINQDSLSVYYSNDQDQLEPFDNCCIVGHDLHFIFNDKKHIDLSGQLRERTAQAFGTGTAENLSKLTIGIAGVSGTGSIVAEQLLRLGVKRLVLVDNDVVERRNLGRILNSTSQDAQKAVNKAKMVQRVYQASGLPTDVIAIDTVILEPQTVRALSQCDILFGCLDSVDGRHQLNRISTFYCIPYFDLGVSLTADGKGGISEITGVVRYVIPGESTLLSRKAYTLDQLNSTSLKRDNPLEYANRLKEKYIQGAQEGSPAVISVNMLTASLGVNDFLARIHPYRDDSNEHYETIWIDLVNMRFCSESPSPSDKSYIKYIGIGDCSPLLNMPVLGDTEK